MRRRLAFIDRFGREFNSPHLHTLIIANRRKAVFAFVCGGGARRLRVLRGELNGGGMFCVFAKQPSRGREHLALLRMHGAKCLVTRDQFHSTCTQKSPSWATFALTLHLFLRSLTAEQLHNASCRSFIERIHHVTYMLSARRFTGRKRD